jgi:short subunit dehydrogenase-like uncharacterized protein
MSGAWMLYGANGYTGELIAREAVRRGLKPVLAARRPEAVETLARELALPSRVFALADAAAVRDGLAGMEAVLHCAGPFVHTAAPMAEACLAGRVHYLDITGEIEVFEAMAARGPAAVAAGIVLLPGSGFDVVPSDCLAAHLKRRLPSATRLELAFQTRGGVSRGTANTMVEGIGRGGAVRRGGRITRVPTAWRTRDVDFGEGPRRVVTIPWGDVATAFHSTGIPDIAVSMAMPPGSIRTLRLARLVEPLLRTQAVRGFLKRRVSARPAGPDDTRRARGRTVVWGEAHDDAGQRVAARQSGPEGYSLTVDAALACLDGVLAGRVPAGFQTPSRAFGPDFVLQLPGVSREDL